MEKAIASNALLTEFDKAINRENTFAEKYDLRPQLFGTEDVLPMWVADMDLPTPAFVLDALKQRLEHPILGYNKMPNELYQAIIEWQAQHNYPVKAGQIRFTHNVANGFFMAVQAFTQPDDAVLVMPPIYPPFLSAPEKNGRKTVEVPLLLIDGVYHIDFTGLENTIIENRAKLLLFCNPQNPSGRVWLREELQQLADICLRHQVNIVSDEIHSDLTFAPHKHTPLASLSDDIAQITVTLSSPGKSFNLGGLQLGYAIIANAKLRQQYTQICQNNAIYDLNTMALHAMLAAYSEQGKSYLPSLKEHLQNNILTFSDFLAQHFPLIKVMQVHAGYLVWLDFSKMFQNHKELKAWLIDKCRLGLNDGLSFGEAGKGYMRINLAVTSETLNQAMQQMLEAKQTR